VSFEENSIPNGDEILIETITTNILPKYIGIFVLSQAQKVSVSGVQRGSDIGKLRTINCTKFLCQLTGEFFFFYFRWFFFDRGKLLWFFFDRGKLLFEIKSHLGTNGNERIRSNQRGSHAV
jgi:hypothetical protein